MRPSPTGGRTPQRDFSKVIRDAMQGPSGRGKLVFAFSSVIGGALDEEVIGTLAEAGVPFLEGTETAMLALRNLQAHRQFLERHAASGTGRRRRASRPQRARERRAACWERSRRVRCCRTTASPSSARRRRAGRRGDRWPRELELSRWC